MNVIMCISECCGCYIPLIICICVLALLIIGIGICVIICLYKFCAKKEEHCHELIKMDKINEYRKGENNENQEKNNDQQ